MKNLINKKITRVLPIVFILFWTGCEDLDFPDPNNPTDDTATIQSLVTGSEAGLLLGAKPIILNPPTQDILVNY